MRDAFTRALMREAAKDDRLMLVTGDLGFGVLKPFWETYPEQFVNAGIAEQSMTGLAAGLAKTGRTVLTYSIGNFPTLRCLEQIRNDCAYHALNVKVVCVGGGFVYGSLGMSHHATEDMAIMRALPGVTVFTPGDPAEVEAIVPVMLKTPGTCYLRLGRGGEPTLPEPTMADAESADIANRYGHRDSLRWRHPDADGERRQEVSRARHFGGSRVLPVPETDGRGEDCRADTPLPPHRDGGGTLHRRRIRFGGLRGCGGDRKSLPHPPHRHGGRILHDCRHAAVSARAVSDG